MTTTPPTGPASRPFSTYLSWLGTSLAVLALGLLASLYRFREQLPPPPFTGSISFDEKAVWLAKRLDAPCDLLAVGSSMTVNNLDSAVFAGRAFLNAGSWGMKIQQTDYFLETLLGYLSPRTVLVVTAPIDFERDYRGRELFDREKLTRFFDSKDLFRAHLEYLSIQYLLESLPAVRRDREGRKTYYALDFDSGGSVPLDLCREGFERRPDRWARPIARAAALDAANYASLATMAQRCREGGMRLVVVQPPIRERVLIEADRRFLESSHWPRIAAICSAEAAIFYNFHGQLALSDDDFADSTHLNREGARKFSRAVLAALGEPPSTAGVPSDP